VLWIHSLHLVDRRIESWSGDSNVESTRDSSYGEREFATAAASWV
jgi:hypothetical protein